MGGGHGGSKRSGNQNTHRISRTGALVVARQPISYAPASEILPLAGAIASAETSSETACRPYRPDACAVLEIDHLARTTYDESHPGTRAPDLDMGDTQ